MTPTGMNLKVWSCTYNSAESLPDDIESEDKKQEGVIGDAR